MKIKIAQLFLVMLIGLIPVMAQKADSKAERERKGW